MNHIDQADFTNKLVLHRIWLANGSMGRRMVIENAVIEGARNPGADLSLAEFKSVVFLNCELPNSSFGSATILKSVFDGSNMRQSNFTGAKIRLSLMKQSNTQGTNFYIVAAANMLGKEGIDLDQSPVMTLPKTVEALDRGFAYDRGTRDSSPQFSVASGSTKGYAL